MRLVVVGANGKMGRALIKAVQNIDGAELVGAIVRKGSEFSGQDAGLLIGAKNLDVKLTDDPLKAFVNADGILDFTWPETSVEYAGYAAQARIVHVIGTTGFDKVQEEKIIAASSHARIIKSGNMSLGVNLLAGLVKKAAQALNANDFDIEISEMHHRYKIDAPSGTALLLGKAAAQGRKIYLEDVCVNGCNGHTGVRETGTIGFSSLRGGTVIGDHNVTFAGDNERIILSHLAQDRAIFANGAVKAALWGENQPKGLYTMMDVLGFNN